MLHKMFVILMTLGSSGAAVADVETSLEFIPVTVGVGDDQTCIMSEGNCLLPSTPDANLVVKSAMVSILKDQERAVSIELSPDDSEAIKRLTATHIGEHLAVMSHGRVIFTGLIKEKLDSRTLQISVQDQRSFDELVRSLKVVD